MRELAEGKGHVLVSLPGNLRVEDLPPDDARDLIAIWHRSALALGDPFRVWAATPVVEFDLAGLEEILAHERVVGLQVPATHLATLSGLERLKPVLALVEEARKPVLVHPRHVVAAPNHGVATSDTLPRAEQLKAAWSTWNEGGRMQHPALRIAFIALAGLAPLALAAASSRGGRQPKTDPNVFYETSAYDERAIDAMARIVGVGPSCTAPIGPSDSRVILSWVACSITPSSRRTRARCSPGSPVRVCLPRRRRSRDPGHTRPAAT
ncbi:hypothetical protein [Frondihabitans sucicola]|nr:hypothetical protein [Frondihabitans sucicola]